MNNEIRHSRRSAGGCNFNLVSQHQAPARAPIPLADRSKSADFLPVNSGASASKPPFFPNHLAEVAWWLSWKDRKDRERRASFELEC